MTALAEEGGDEGVDVSPADGHESPSAPAGDVLAVDPEVGSGVKRVTGERSACLDGHVVGRAELANHTSIDHNRVGAGKIFSGA